MLWKGKNPDTIQNGMPVGDMKKYLIYGIWDKFIEAKEG